MNPKTKKRGSLLQKTVVHIIIVALVLALLLMGVMRRGSKDDIKMDLLEKQTALLIEASPQGTILEINEQNINGLISRLEITDNKIYIDVGNAKSTEGYRFFSQHTVTATKEENKYIIRIE